MQMFSFLQIVFAILKWNSGRIYLVWFCCFKKSFSVVFVHYRSRAILGEYHRRIRLVSSVRLVFSVWVWIKKYRRNFHHLSPSFWPKWESETAWVYRQFHQKVTCIFSFPSRRLWSLGCFVCSAHFLSTLYLISKLLVEQDWICNGGTASICVALISTPNLEQERCAASNTCKRECAHANFSRLISESDTGWFCLFLPVPKDELIPPKNCNVTPQNQCWVEKSLRKACFQKMLDSVTFSKNLCGFLLQRWSPYGLNSRSHSLRKTMVHFASRFSASLLRMFVTSAVLLVGIRR